MAQNTRASAAVLAVTSGEEGPDLERAQRSLVASVSKSGKSSRRSFRSARVSAAPSRTSFWSSSSRWFVIEASAA